MEFVQCSYIGQSSEDGRRFDGIGRYTFPNGDVYLGGMQDGQFHGQGVVFFRCTPGFTKARGLSMGHSASSSATSRPESKADHTAPATTQEDPLKAFLSPSGPTPSAASAEGWSGQYRGLWEHGLHIAGEYVFQDGLIYRNDSAGQAAMSSVAWSYCHGSDHRLWEEYLENVAPVLPHEALLGGAKLLHERKHATRAVAAEANAPMVDVEKCDGGEGEDDNDDGGEGLPMVLPNAFVQARAAPAFAQGQLAGLDDRRIVRWTAAAAALGGATSQAASLEMVEATVALQLGLSRSTEGCQAGEQRDGADAQQGTEEDEKAAQPKLNLTVCRVRDVEDVNRALVQVVPAPS